MLWVCGAAVWRPRLRRAQVGRVALTVLVAQARSRAALGARGRGYRYECYYYEIRGF